MSRQKHQRPQPMTQQQAVPVAPPAKSLAGHDLKAHRRCPLCWSLAQGYGTAYSTAANGRTYYKCSQTLTEHSPCGHTWSVVVSLNSVVVEHREVDVDGKR